MEFKTKELYKKQKGIYMITNKFNNKVYIGQTRQPIIKRYWHHLWKLKDNSHDNIHLQNSFNKYGIENFEFTVLSTVVNVDELNELEISYISKFREEGLCFNIQDGGQKIGNYIRTDEIKKSIGEKNRIHMTGKKLSEETKKKMSESHKANKYNEVNYVLNETIAHEIKSLLVEGLSATKVSDKLNIPYKLINNILSNNAWSRVEVQGWNEYLNSRTKTTRFTIEDCIEVYNLYEEGLYNQSQLAEMYNKNRASISNAIKRAKKHLNIC